MLLHHSSHKDGHDSVSYSWLKKAGWLGFLFFLIKGLLWLIVPGILLYLGIL